MGHSFIQTALDGVIIVEPDVYKDERGFFAETYRYDSYSTNSITAAFVQDNHSHSACNVLRGMHYQLKHPQGKLVTAITGEIFDVAVDIRYGSPTFGKWVGVTLNAENKRQLWIPGGFAHGFCVTSPIADVLYKCTDYYAPDDDYGLLWSDPNIKIDWPVATPILSPKDQQHSTLAHLTRDKLPVFIG